MKSKIVLHKGTQDLSVRRLFLVPKLISVTWLVKSDMRD